MHERDAGLDDDDDEEDYHRDGDEDRAFDEDGEDIDEEEEWDREGSKLYEWTQELSFNDDLMQTPMMAT